MNLLLDSHAVIWALTAPQNLSVKAKRELTKTGNELLLSMASLFELTVKMNIGKLIYKGGLKELFNDIDAARYSILPIERNHLIEYSKLPMHHRDPFDRLIIAQALSDNLAVVSKDEQFKKYGIKIIW